MSGSVSIKSGNENDLQTAVANVGPVSVAIDGANSAFRVSLITNITHYYTVKCELRCSIDMGMLSLLFNCKGFVINY